MIPDKVAEIIQVLIIIIITVYGPFYNFEWTIF